MQDWTKILEGELSVHWERAAAPAWLAEAETGQILSATAAALELYGYSAEAFLRLTISDLMTPEDLPLWLAASSERSPRFRAALWRHRRQSGALLAVRLFELPLQAAGRRLLLFLAQDATAECQAIMEAASRERCWRSLLAQLPGCHFILAPDGTIRDCAGAEDFLAGASAAQCRGRKIFELLRAEEVHRLRDWLTVVQAPGERPISFRQSLRAPGGDWADFDASLRPFTDPGKGPAFLLSCRRSGGPDDHAQEARAAGRNLEALGDIAAGVAHNFNNILTVVNLHAGLLAGSAPANSDAASSSQEMMRAVERASDITRHLLAFARKQLMNFEEMDLNAWLREFAKGLPKLLGARIRVQLDLAEKLPAISGDKRMLELLLANLAENSRDSMAESGGSFAIRTSIESLAPARLGRNPDARPGEHVCVTVEDSGAGIALADLERVFDPFFTTKAVGAGAGLGLAAAYGIAKQHGGWIEAASRPNEGATFRIFLPPAVKLGKLAADHSRKKMSACGKDTILLVEDEPAVRAVVRKILRNHGFDVLEAASGAEALKVWKESGNLASLLLTDVLMPGGLTGWELASQLRSEKPDLKVIFTSGYSKEITMPKEWEAGAIFLEKPFDPTALMRVIGQALPPSAQANPLNVD